MYRFLLLFFLLSSCATKQLKLNYLTPTVPLYPIQPAPQKIILFNGFDVRAQDYRENKEQLFIEMIDSLLELSALRIQRLTGIPTQVLKGYTYSGSVDTVSQLLKKHDASHAIIITDFNIEFIQTRVDVTRNSDNSKSRQAYYDIRCKTSYALYNTKEVIRADDVTLTEDHSSRSVMSGLLAAGPNVVAQRKDAMNIAVANIHNYLNRFFPGERMRFRSVYVGKGFESTAAAIARGDYEAALIESMKLISSSDAKTAAKANYNCAVFFERKNQPAESKKYLEASLRLANLDRARMMMMED